MPCVGRFLPPELVLPRGSRGPALVLGTRQLRGGTAELGASAHEASPEPHRSVLLRGLGANRAGGTWARLSEVSGGSDTAAARLGAGECLDALTRRHERTMPVATRPWGFCSSSRPRSAPSGGSGTPSCAAHLEVTPCWRKPLAGIANQVGSGAAWDPGRLFAPRELLLEWSCRGSLTPRGCASIKLSAVASL